MGVIRPPNIWATRDRGIFAKMEYFQYNIFNTIFSQIFLFFIDADLFIAFVYSSLLSDAVAAT